MSIDKFHKLQNNLKITQAINMNGYFNQLANLADGDYGDGFTDNFGVSSNGSGGGGIPSLPPASSKKPIRPNGLPLKKETPL